MLRSFCVFIGRFGQRVCRPQFGTKERGFRVRQFTHPLLDAQRAVPNDLEARENELLLITGPNMGGKSTYLKQAALAVYLAHIGCFVPAASCEIPPIEAIVTRVGASDNLQAGVSTFMKEMVETAQILRSLDRNCLVIIDELGRGTSTQDGFSLAWSIAEHLAERGACYCLFATHFWELTRLEQSCARVRNFSFAADGDRMSYRLQPGSSRESFGIRVMEMLAMDRTLIDGARAKLADYEKNKLATTHKQRALLLAQETYERIRADESRKTALLAELRTRLDALREE